MTDSFPLTPVPAEQVHLQAGFWQTRQDINRRVTLPANLHHCQRTGRFDNFAKAAGQLAGPHLGYRFNDSDVFKVIEGAAHSLAQHSDPELVQQLDDLISLIAAAQEPDGYLYTARTVDPAVVTSAVGPTRWSNLRLSHELYNLGHLYEAAVAHFQATGQRNLLDVALKSADFICQTFGPQARRDVPGHQEIEIGLVKLYHLTDETRYLETARFFLEERGQANGRTLQEDQGHVGYMQDHLPLSEQTEAVGHAVRAAYFYTAVADVAAVTQDESYLAQLKTLWADVVGRKMYVTGGIGSMHRGEAFGAAYELPNRTAYAETCAAIATIFWNFRLFSLFGEAKYLDVLERVLYNGFLAGISLDGEAFFYPNPLAADGEWGFNKGELTRQAWFECACCPTNVVRFLPTLGGYIYSHHHSHHADTLYVNLFINSRATVPLTGGSVQITQETNYPWQGDINLTVEPETARRFALHIRWPGWAQNQPLPSDLYRYADERPLAWPRVTVNGAAVGADSLREAAGFLILERFWSPGDRVSVSFDLPVRQVISHPKLKTNAGRVALERGPLVYCVEAVDNGGQVTHLRLPAEMRLTAEARPDLLDGVTIIQGQHPDYPPLTAIPYYAWANRGVGKMSVWLKRG